MTSRITTNAKKIQAALYCLLLAFVLAHSAPATASKSNIATTEKAKKDAAHSRASGRASATIVKPMRVQLINGKIEVSANVRYQVSRSKRGDVTIIFE